MIALATLPCLVTLVSMLANAAFLPKHAMRTGPTRSPVTRPKAPAVTHHARHVIDRPFPRSLTVAKSLLEPLPHQRELDRFEHAWLAFRVYRDQEQDVTKDVATTLLLSLVQAKRVLPVARYYATLVDAMTSCMRMRLFDGRRDRLVLARLRIQEELMDAASHFFYFDNLENYSALKAIVNSFAALGHFFGRRRDIQHTLQARLMKFGDIDTNRRFCTR
jgi:hypothetical protein